MGTVAELAVPARSEAVAREALDAAAAELRRIESLMTRYRSDSDVGRFNEAEECFSKSLELKPDNAWLHFNRGLMCLELEQPLEALQFFETSLKVDSPKLPPSKRQRAEGAIHTLRTKLGTESEDTPDSPPNS